MTMVYQADRPVGALGQTHVLILAVGTYPHLVGGAQDRGPTVTGGMEQLDSPPLSANAIADWFIATFRNPERPLGSIAMLVSDGDEAHYNPGGAAQIALARPDIPQLIAATNAWKARGDANGEDMLVLYFSGHGISSGARTVLLARDYGEIEDRPMRGAINFGDMLEGMKSCKAVRQVYFIDACRSGSEILLRNATETGDVLIATSYPITPGWCQSVYFASLGGKAAYGQNGKVSLFARALLKSFRGPGASNAEGDWRINTSRLQEALTHFASGLADPEHGPVQIPQSGNQTTFDFHYFAETPPAVPVYVEPDWHRGPSPPPDMQRISIAFGGAALVDWPRPWADSAHCCWAPDRFESWLEPDRNYRFELQIEGQPMSAPVDSYVTPPFKRLRIPRHG